MPAAPRAEVAYFRVAEVHTAHLGSGKTLLGANCEGVKRKHLHSADLANDGTAYILHDGTDTRKFDDPPTAGSTLEDFQFKYFGLPLCAISANLN